MAHSSNTIIILTLFLSGLSSCKKEKISEENRTTKTQSEASLKRQQSGNNIADESILREFDFHGISVKDTRPLPTANSISDTGNEVPLQEIPAYAKLVLAELNSAILKESDIAKTSQKLTQLASRYWIEDFEVTVDIANIDFSVLFRSSSKFVEELRKGSSTSKLTDDEMSGAYGLYAVYALYSQTNNSGIDKFFKERMSKEEPQLGDIFLARIASDVNPFKNSSQEENINMLKNMGNSKNPIYRALAIYTGKSYIKNEQDLFTFYKTFENDLHISIRRLVIDEIALQNSPGSLSELQSIKNKIDDKNDPIYKHAATLFEGLPH